MKLWQAKRHANELVGNDPFLAVRTESEKRGNRRAIDEFYATGVAEVLSLPASAGAALIAVEATVHGEGDNSLCAASRAEP